MTANNVCVTIRLKSKIGGFSPVGELGVGFNVDIREHCRRILAERLDVVNDEKARQLYENPFDTTFWETDDYVFHVAILDRHF